jgi:hypothetical protein
MFDAYRTINALRRRARHHKPAAAIGPVTHEEIAHKLGQLIEREWRNYPIIRCQVGCKWIEHEHVKYRAKSSAK